MLIGDLSKKSGLSRHTIRYYEELGLISIGKKERRDNNYKEYPEEALERLLIINRLKLLGFTLVEIGDLLGILAEENNPCADILESVNKKITLIDQKMAELLKVRARLLSIKTNCNGHCKMEDILPDCISC